MGKNFDSALRIMSGECGEYVITEDGGSQCVFKVVSLKRSSKGQVYSSRAVQIVYVDIFHPLYDVYSTCLRGRKDPWIFCNTFAWGEFKSDLDGLVKRWQEEVWKYLKGIGEDE